MRLADFQGGRKLWQRPHQETSHARRKDTSHVQFTRRVIYGNKCANSAGVYPRNQSRRPAYVRHRCPAQPPRHPTTAATTSSPSHPTTASYSPTRVQPPRRPAMAAMTSSSPAQVHGLLWSEVRKSFTRRCHQDFVRLEDPSAPQMHAHLSTSPKPDVVPWVLGKWALYWLHLNASWSCIWIVQCSVPIYMNTNKVTLRYTYMNSAKWIQLVAEAP